MFKDLTSKMHMKMKLFTLKMEGGSVLNHISVFKDEDLGPLTVMLSA
jgi:hypothetical protein